jgi:hypothetical protein
MNSHAQPRDGSRDKAPRLGFNAPWRTMTYDGTYQQPSIVPLFTSPLCLSPCDYEKREECNGYKG